MRPAKPNVHLSRQRPTRHLGVGEHYCEYPFEDFGFRRVTEIEKSVALGLLSESVYTASLSDMKVMRLEQGTIIDMMNKGAIRTNWDRLWICKHDSRWWIAEEPAVEGLVRPRKDG